MRAVLACLACTTACGFQSPAVTSDAALDAPLPPIDAAIDAMPPDLGPSSRVRADLIGLWTFDEQLGTTVADTSDAVTKVPLGVVLGSVIFSNGTMTPDGIAVIRSTPVPHLNADVITKGAVTLEAWVMPAAANQGTAAQPVLVAGLSASINSRNISLLQAGTRWVARVRTTADANGKPDLTSTVDITPNVMTHLVVVADATQRILYVDGQPVAVDAAPGPPLGWDKAYRMTLGNEINQGRQWVGTFALVAMYQQALSPVLIGVNYALGPEAP